MKQYSYKNLEDMFDFFEVKKDTPLLLHSSLFHLGLLENEDISNIPKKLVDFFSSNLESFFQPTFNYSFPKTGFIDLTLANSEVGILSNEMIKQKFLRTTHPIFSFVGNNQEILLPQKKELNPFGKDSFLDRFTQNNGVVIILGAKPFVATYIIYSEFMANVKYRFLKPFYGEVKTKFNIFKDNFYHFGFPLNGGYKHNYCKFHKYLIKNNIAKEFQIGASKAYGFKTQEFNKALKDYIKNEPFKLLDKKPLYYYQCIDNQESIVKEVK